MYNTYPTTTHSQIPILMIYNKFEKYCWVYGHAQHNMEYLFLFILYYIHLLSYSIAKNKFLIFEIRCICPGCFLAHPVFRWIFAKIWCFLYIILRKIFAFYLAHLVSVFALVFTNLWSRCVESFVYIWRTLYNPE